MYMSMQYVERVTLVDVSSCGQTRSTSELGNQKTKSGSDEQASTPKTFPFNTTIFNSIVPQVVGQS